MNESADNLLRAFLARSGDAQLGLLTSDALYKEGHEEEAVAVWALADDADPRLRLIKNAPNAPAEARAASARADDAFKTHFTRLHVESIDALAKTTDADLSSVRDAIWPLTHHRPVEYGPRCNDRVFSIYRACPPSRSRQTTACPGLNSSNRRGARSARNISKPSRSTS